MSMNDGRKLAILEKLATYGNPGNTGTAKQMLMRKTHKLAKGVTSAFNNRLKSLSSKAVTTKAPKAMSGVNPAPLPSPPKFPTKGATPPNMSKMGPNKTLIPRMEKKAGKMGNLMRSPLYGAATAVYKNPLFGKQMQSAYRKNVAAPGSGGFLPPYSAAQKSANKGTAAANKLSSKPSLASQLPFKINKQNLAGGANNPHDLGTTNIKARKPKPATGGGIRMKRGMGYNWLAKKMGFKGTGAQLKSRMGGGTLHAGKSYKMPSAAPAKPAAPARAPIRFAKKVEKRPKLNLLGAKRPAPTPRAMPTNTAASRIGKRMGSPTAAKPTPAQVAAANPGKVRMAPKM
jgi:hypothetical protein